MRDCFNQAWFRKLLLDADWVGVRHIHRTISTRSVLNDRPELNKINLDVGVSFEILIDGHIGYGGTNDLTQEGLIQCFYKTKALTTASSSNKIFSFKQDSVRPPTVGKYQTAKMEDMDNLSVQEIFDILQETTSRMKTSSDISSRSAFLQWVKKKQYFFSSSGAEIEQDFSNVTTHLQSRATRAGETQSRSDMGFMACTYQRGIQELNKNELYEKAYRLSEEAIELLSAPPCPEFKGELLLAPDQMLMQIHESVGHPLELDRILGDERNYAGWSFVKSSDFGKLQYGNSKMNIVFDPFQESSTANYGFDDSGARAQFEYLIKDGILIRAIGGLESQSRSNISGVAASRAVCWNRPPIDRMGNINLVPGRSSLAEMIESIEEGVLMFSNRSWSIDDYRNKFQFGCEYGKYIKNGKIIHTLKNPNYRGQTLPFWQNLKAVGDIQSAQTLGAAFCGKGEPNQAIHVGHTSPYCLFENVEIFGGHV